ncbi:MAG: AAA family ATPase [Chitinophagales bacterium]
MIRLKSIYIKGFKDPTHEKKLVFSEEPISVIYGENGSGKTTLLKILFAVLSRDEDILLKEKVREVYIEYIKNQENKRLSILIKEDGYINWGRNSDLYGMSSILFGVHRGVNQEIGEVISKNSVLTIISNLIDVLSGLRGISSSRENFIVQLSLLADKFEYSEEVDLDELSFLLNEIRIKFDRYFNNIENNKIKKIHEHIRYMTYINTYGNEEVSFFKKMDSRQNLSTNFVKIKDIQNVIINQYNKGQNVISQKIKSAFFETIEKAIEIDENNEGFQLPNDFEERIEANKDFILRAIVKEDSSLTTRIKKYLETRDEKLTQNSKIFRAMLLNIVESAEEPNPELESITKLIKVFNEHLYGDKKLVIDSERAFIDLGEGKFHALSELSSGERNLLSILTLFLIIGKNRNFLMIDEPEISFNIKWQRRFLPLLSRLNSNAQIIVASHSPSIAHENSKYLVELK